MILLIAFAPHSQSEASQITKENSFFGVVRGGDDGSIDAHYSTTTSDLKNANIDKADFSQSENEEEDSWRLNLPFTLQQRRGSLHRILIPSNKKNERSNDEIPYCELYLLGTAHVSKDSCEDARLLMNHIKPDVLFVELCNQRTAILEDDENVVKISSNEGDGDSSSNSNSEEKKSVSQLTKEIMIHNPGMSKTAALSSVLLSKIQGDYAEKLGVNIGGEFKEAFNVAKRQHKAYMEIIGKIQNGIQLTDDEMNGDIVHGCAVVLGDRPVRLTLLRTWESLSFFGKIKLVCGLIWSSLRQPDEKELKEWIESIMNDPTNDILTKSIEELSRHFPTVKETIIAERDIYMSCKLLQTAQVLGQASAKDGNTRRIVAIVGAGHCPGIRKHLSHESTFANNNVEEALKTVIETKKNKILDSPDMNSLINEVESIEIL